MSSGSEKWTDPRMLLTPTSRKYSYPNNTFLPHQHTLTLPTASTWCGLSCLIFFFVLFLPQLTTMTGGILVSATGTARQRFGALTLSLATTTLRRTTMTECFVCGLSRSECSLHRSPAKFILCLNMVFRYIYICVQHNSWTFWCLKAPISLFSEREKYKWEVYMLGNKSVTC